MISDVDTSNDGDGRDADPSDPGDWISDADKTANPAAFGDCDVQDSSWHGTQTAGLIGARPTTASAWPVSAQRAGSAGAGARQVRRLGLRHPGRHALGRRPRGSRRAGQPDTGARDQHEPRKCRRLRQRLPAGGGRSDGRRVTIVSSAGNSEGQAVATPANCAGMIAVAALRHVGTKVGFSDIGPEIALSAPGGNCINIGAGQPCLYPILTTSNSGTTTPRSVVRSTPTASTSRWARASPLRWSPARRR
jgi:serine protease